MTSQKYSLNKRRRLSISEFVTTSITSDCGSEDCSMISNDRQHNVSINSPATITRKLTILKLNKYDEKEEEHMESPINSDDYYKTLLQKIVKEKLQESLKAFDLRHKISGKAEKLVLCTRDTPFKQTLLTIFNNYLSPFDISDSDEKFDDLINNFLSTSEYSSYNNFTHKFDIHQVGYYKSYVANKIMLHVLENHKGYEPFLNEWKELIIWKRFGIELLNYLSYYDWKGKKVTLKTGRDNLVSLALRGSFNNEAQDYFNGICGMVTTNDNKIGLNEYRFKTMQCQKILEEELRKQAYKVPTIGTQVIYNNGGPVFNQSHQSFELFLDRSNKLTWKRFLIALQEQLKNHGTSSSIAPTIGKQIIYNNGGQVFNNSTYNPQWNNYFYENSQQNEFSNFNKYNESNSKNGYNSYNKFDKFNSKNRFNSQSGNYYNKHNRYNRDNKYNNKRNESYDNSIDDNNDI